MAWLAYRRRYVPVVCTVSPCLPSAPGACSRLQQDSVSRMSLRPRIHVINPTYVHRSPYAAPTTAAASATPSRVLTLSPPLAASRTLSRCACARQAGPASMSSVAVKTPLGEPRRDRRAIRLVDGTERVVNGRRQQHPSGTRAYDRRQDRFTGTASSPTCDNRPRDKSARSSTCKDLATRFCLQRAIRLLRER